MKIYKILIAICLLLVAGFALLILLLFGISTDVSTNEIPDGSLAKCKEAVAIIQKNGNYINSELIKKAAANGECIRYIVERPQDFDKLFSNANPNDLAKLKQLFATKFCENIEISETKNCIMFQMKTSRNDSHFIGAFRSIYFIYEDQPKCNCKDNPAGYPNRTKYVKPLSPHWYEVKVEFSTRYFGC